MALSLLALVLLAAALHVAWNAVARSIAAKETFAWLTALVGVGVLAPLFVWSRLHDGEGPAPIDARTLRFVALSACIEAAYFLLLQASYRRAELSLVYPLSRGVAPLLVLVPARIWTGETLTAREYFGVAVIVAGAFALVQTHRESGVGATRFTRASGIGFALATGAAIAAYQLVDGVALRGASAPRPLEYLFLMQLGLAILLTISFLRTRSGARVRDALAESRADWPRLLTAGVAIQASYLMVLFALRDGPIPIVITARNGGIPLSLIVAWFALKEKFTARRIAAALCIVAGVVLLVKW